VAVAALFAGSRGEVHTAEELCGAALRAADRLDVLTPSLQSQTRSFVGLAKVTVGDIAAGTADYEQCVQLARSAGALEALAGCLAVAANGHVLVGDHHEAVPFAVEAVSLARQIGRPDLLVRSLLSLAGALADQDRDHARSYLSESLRLIGTFGNVRNAQPLAEAFFTAAGMGDWDTALEAASPAIRAVSESAYRQGCPRHCLPS
jgi:hypothetical protein